MNVNELGTSKFLTKHDVDPPVLVTIVGCEKMNVAMETQAPEEKWTMTFKELDKPLVLNPTNGQLIAAITGSEESDGWIGKQIMLYNDPTVSFAGKLTGGIRVRAVQTQADRVNPNYVGGPLEDAPSGPEPPARDTTDHDNEPKF